MTETLGRPAWLAAPDTAAVLDALETAGGEGCARFVGGCVRNAILGREVDDLDIATVLVPERVTAALKAAGLKAIPTGIDHGTVTAVAHGRPFEITTLRRDVSTDGRRAVVAFTTDWNEDAARRDFTLNALYAGRDGAVVDPTGRGLADARAGRIVFVGAPETRIREDYLRILRFFRFRAWYGRGAPDPAAVRACAALKAGIATLAAERISKEFLKLLAAADPRAAVALMAKTGVLAEVLPEADDRARFDSLVRIEADTDAAPDPLLRLAALCAADSALATARRLRLSNAQRDRLIAAEGLTPGLTASMSPREMRRAVHAIGAAAFADRAMLAWAADSKREHALAWRALVASGSAWRPPDFPFDGEAVVAAGVPRGPKVGQALRDLEAWWIEADFPLDRDAALARLAGLAGRKP